MRIIDLTKPIYPGMKVYEGDPEVEFHQYKTLREDGYNVTLIKMGTHTGTHTDAPIHMIENSGTIDSANLSDYIGIALKIETDKKVLDHKDVPNIEPQRSNIIPLIKTAPAGYITKKAAEKLVKLGIKTLIFHENCLIDDPKDTSFPIHKFLLKNNIRIVSEAINFEKVKDGDLIIVAPLKLIGVDGAPCRVIAIGDYCDEYGGTSIGRTRG